MRKDIIAYLITAAVFFSMDFVWLSLMSGPVYKARLGNLMLDKPNLPVAAGFYLIYIFAVVIFAVSPALRDNNWLHALWAGALFGLAAYGTYDLTNQATLAGWSSFISIVDMAWGITATTIAALAGFFLTRALD
jgi:uncharacterized membrane protein